MDHFFLMHRKKLLVNKISANNQLIHIIICPTQALFHWSILIDKTKICIKSMATFILALFSSQKMIEAEFIRLEFIQADVIKMRASILYDTCSRVPFC